VPLSKLLAGSTLLQRWGSARKALAVSSRSSRILNFARGLIPKRSGAAFCNAASQSQILSRAGARVEKVRVKLLGLIRHSSIAALGEELLCQLSQQFGGVLLLLAAGFAVGYFFVRFAL
jgi:hypothetical protein